MVNFKGERVVTGLQEYPGTASWPFHNTSSVFGLYFQIRSEVNGEHPHNTIPCLTIQEKAGVG